MKSNKAATNASRYNQNDPRSTAKNQDESRLVDPRNDRAKPYLKPEGSYGGMRVRNEDRDTNPDHQKGIGEPVRRAAAIMQEETEGEADVSEAENDGESNIVDSAVDTTTTSGTKTTGAWIETMTHTSAVNAEIPKRRRTSCSSESSLETIQEETEEAVEAATTDLRLAERETRADSGEAENNPPNRDLFTRADCGEAENNPPNSELFPSEYAERDVSETRDVGVVTCTMSIHNCKILAPLYAANARCADTLLVPLKPKGSNDGRHGCNVDVSNNPDRRTGVRGPVRAADEKVSCPVDRRARNFSLRAQPIRNCDSELQGPSAKLNKTIETDCDPKHKGLRAETLKRTKRNDNLTLLDKTEPVATDCVQTGYDALIRNTFREQPVSKRTASNAKTVTGPRALNRRTSLRGNPDLQGSNKHNQASAP